MLPKVVFEEYILFLFHYPIMVSKRIGNTLRGTYLGDLTRKSSRGRQRVAPHGTTQPYLVRLQKLHTRQYLCTLCYRTIMFTFFKAPTRIWNSFFMKQRRNCIFMVQMWHGKNWFKNLEYSWWGTLNGHYAYNLIYPHPSWDNSNYSYPSLIRGGGGGQCSECRMNKKM